MARLSQLTATEPLTEAAFTFLDGPPNINHNRRVYLAPSSQLEEAPTFRRVSKIPIQDLRGREDTLDIETHGLQFVRSHSRFHLTPDQKTNIDQYLLETTAIVKEVLNAELVICYDYKFRKNDVDVIAADGKIANDRSFYAGPSEYPHGDSTETGGLLRTRRYLTQFESKKYLDEPGMWRVRHINAWRAFGQPVEDRPLAFCDYFSVRREDIVTAILPTSKDFRGETYLLRHHEDQRWFWLSNQMPEEMALFLTFDSHPGNGPKFCPHTSFANPTAKANKYRRESVEIRFIVITEVEAR